jgi:hypothetical protein
MVKDLAVLEVVVYITLMHKKVLFYYCSESQQLNNVLF